MKTDHLQDIHSNPLAQTQCRSLQHSCEDELFLSLPSKAESSWELLPPHIWICEQPPPLRYNYKH